MSKLLLKNAVFVTSAPDTAHLPEIDVPEFAFLGRSNVGKSSLINLVAGQHRLAHTSRTPGRTRLLNYFTATLQKTEDETREECAIGIVDLPGFGYAKMSGSERERLSEIVSDYINSRPHIRTTFHLVDIRREPNSEDIELSRQLRALKPNYVLVITKADKVVKSKRKAALSEIATGFEINASDVVLTSVDEKFGQHDIWRYMWETSQKA